MKYKKIIFSICIMIFLVGCQSNDGQVVNSNKVELLFSAAASLTDVLQEQVKEYNKINPDVTITLTFAGSGTLQSQIENGAPVDIFMPAAEKNMDNLNKGGHMISSSIKNVLKNEVILITYSNNKLEINSFEDLTKEDIKKIGIGDPEYVPVGQYSKDIFESLGIYNDIESKLVLGNDVRTVLNWVVKEEVDCGIVYSTDLYKIDNVKLISNAPENTHKSVIYPIGILKNSKHQEAAKDFIDFLFTDKAKEIFQAYGFINAE